ncbi:MAG: 50S ribosomal protein L10 [Actinomycetota bacterium]|nr:50S ribosomal protein L10 [Actinomycetota bacterium]
MADTNTRADPRPDKVAAVARMSEAFRDSTASLLTEYRGLTVAQLTELRSALGNETTYAVVKNTLTKRAATLAGLDLDETLFTGPTAIAFVGGDPVTAAKGLRDFSRTHPRLIVKGAVLEGRFLSADEVRQLADLESREALLARLAGAMTASLSQAAALFQAPLSQVARLAAALQDKRAAAEPAAEAAGPETEAGEAPGPEAAAPEAEVPEAAAPDAEAPEAEAAAPVPAEDAPADSAPEA